MLLAVDIGNTSITFGLFKGKRPMKVFRVATVVSMRTLQNRVKKALARYKEDIDSIIICSVVPEKTVVLKNVLRQLLKIKARVVGKDIKVPIKNLYKNPKQVGMDRLVNAYACKSIYGTPAVIIDFGTATTFDYLTRKGEYAGGIIAPGIEISLDALFQKCALLPKIKMKEPKSFLGKDTVTSIRSGATYGLSLMCDGLIDEFKKHYGKDIKVVATGGLAYFFKKRCKGIDIVDKDFILKGLRLFFP